MATTTDPAQPQPPPPRPSRRRLWLLLTVAGVVLAAVAAIVLVVFQPQKLFIDDRVDMYPVQVSKDYVHLLQGGERWAAILDRYGVDVVLWDRTLPLAQLLELDSQWRETFRHGDWIVYQRTFRP